MTGRLAQGSFLRHPHQIALGLPASLHPVKESSTATLPVPGRSNEQLMVPEARRGQCKDREINEKIGGFCSWVGSYLQANY